MDALALFIAATLNAATPIALAGLGLLVNERAGVVNLGAEGMMLIAAVAGFGVALATGSQTLGMATGALAGAGSALALAALVVGLGANAYATGLALSLFGGGFSAFVGLPFVGKSLPAWHPAPVPVLGDLPFVGPALFREHPVVYLAIVATIAVGWLLRRTRAGLVLRAIGESPEAAHALGYRVRTIRVAAVVAGGALCGLAGAYISVAYTPLWVENMIAGRGWIALALTTFATWRPLRVLLGAWLFGGVTMLQFQLQAAGVQVSSQLLAMLPYLATVLVLALISRNPAWIRANMPASLGRPFRPEH